MNRGKNKDPTHPSTEKKRKTMKNIPQTSERKSANNDQGGHRASSGKKRKQEKTLKFQKEGGKNHR